MSKERIAAKIQELEKELASVGNTYEHQKEYKKLLKEKIESYKRLYKQARHERRADPLEEAFGRKPDLVRTKGDPKREKKGSYLRKI